MLVYGDTYRETEGIGFRAQLLNQPLLQVAQRPLVLLQRREDLEGADKQILPKGEAQNIKVLPAVTE